MELRDLKVGNFVRTRYGIGKIDNAQMFMNKYFQVHLDTNKGKIYSVPDNSYWNDEKDIIKASDKLIDLVEIRDYVNGCKVVEILKETIIIENYGEEELFEKDIKTIVTKEMFDQMSYKVGE